MECSAGELRASRGKSVQSLTELLNLPWPCEHVLRLRALKRIFFDMKLHLIWPIGMRGDQLRGVLAYTINSTERNAYGIVSPGINAAFRVTQNTQLFTGPCDKARGLPSERPESLGWGAHLLVELTAWSVRHLGLGSKLFSSRGALLSAVVRSQAQKHGGTSRRRTQAVCCTRIQRQGLAPEEQLPLFVSAKQWSGADHCEAHPSEDHREHTSGSPAMAASEANATPTAAVTTGKPVRQVGSADHGPKGHRSMPQLPKKLIIYPKRR